MIVSNPLITGFNPDPSICRVGEDYYIATSTFEWFPGVQIWHSRNLSEWRLLHRPLDSCRLLCMGGVESSGGVWAPCLTHSDGRFYLAYTVVRNWRGETPVDYGVFKDTFNFVTTAPSITGPWSEPVFQNATGFDPSLFHDEGRVWLLNMEWDYRGSPTHFTGILLQELDPRTLTPKGTIHKIFEPTELDRVEGPHLYRREGWYYLVTAEGGTGYEHAVTVARSKEITGPYEVHPDNPMLSSLRDRVTDVESIEKLATGCDVEPPQDFYHHPQKAGHASLCPINDDEWILVHLSGRPVPGSASCPLGRETSIQLVRWFDDWPYVVDSRGNPVLYPQQQIELPTLCKAPTNLDHAEKRRYYLNTDKVISDNFQGPELHPAFRFLRRHPGDDLDLDVVAGRIRLVGRESPLSRFRQTLVAVSVGSFQYRVETCLHFSPESYRQMAGLIVRYDERNQYYLRIAGGESGKSTLGVIRFAAGKFDMPVTPEITLTASPVSLRLQVDGDKGSFSWMQENEVWHDVSVELDMLQLSDEGTWPEGFTGTFAGMACHDLSGLGCTAEFSMFHYEEL